MRAVQLAVTAMLASPALATEPVDLRKLPMSEPTLVSSFGPAKVQFGERRVPAGKGPHPVAIIYHGGCLMRAVDDVRGTAAIATALTAKGVATWNVDYRALGDAGVGYPGTYQDWGAAADHLRTLAKANRLDLSRVVAVGHSAGAPAAVFVSARPKLPSPATYLPTGVPLTLISSSFVLPMPLAESYEARGVAAGDRVEVIKIDGDHCNVIAPGQPQWIQVEAVILRALGK